MFCQGKRRFLCSGLSVQPGVLLQTALGEAVRNEKNQERDQGVVALAKKAQDLYRQQQEIIKKADQKYAHYSHALLEAIALCLVCNDIPSQDKGALTSPLHSLNSGWQVEARAYNLL